MNDFRLQKRIFYLLSDIIIDMALCDYETVVTYTFANPSKKILVSRNDTQN